MTIHANLTHAKITALVTESARIRVTLGVLVSVTLLVNIAKYLESSRVLRTKIAGMAVLAWTTGMMRQDSITTKLARGGRVLAREDMLAIFAILIGPGATQGMKKSSGQDKNGVLEMVFVKTLREIRTESVNVEPELMDANANLPMITRIRPRGIGWTHLCAYSGC